MGSGVGLSGTFDLEAAEGVCSGGVLGAEEVLDALLGLLDKSILAREEGEGGVRYRLLNTVREFGAVWLERLGETGETGRRHRDHFLGLSARAEMSWQGRQLEWYRRLVLECANMRGAIEYCYSRPEEYRKGLDLVGNLWFLWACLRHAGPPGTIFSSVVWISTTPPAPSGSRHCGCTPGSRSSAATSTGRSEFSPSAPPRTPTAMPRPTSASSRLTWRSSGAMWWRHSSSFSTPRGLHRSTGNVFPGFLPTYTVVATAMMLTGRHDQAVSVLEEGRELCESCGDYWTLIRLDLLLGQAEHLLGNTASAVVAARGALRGARLFGDTISLMEALEVFVVIAETDTDDTFRRDHVRRGPGRLGEREVPPSRSPMITSLLRNAELRLRGRMGRAEFERLNEEGGMIGLRAAVEHALQGAFS